MLVSIMMVSSKPMLKILLSLVEGVMTGCNGLGCLLRVMLERMKPIFPVALTTKIMTPEIVAVLETLI